MLKNGDKFHKTAQYHISAHCTVSHFCTLHSITFQNPQVYFHFENCSQFSLPQKQYIQTKFNKSRYWKLLVSQLFYKFVPFYGSRRFIIMFTKAYHRFSLTQFTPFQLLSLWITPSLPLGLPSDLFPSDFPTIPHIHFCYQSHHSPVVFC